MPKLTKSQQKIFDYLLSRRDDGIPPTVREICNATGFSSTSTVQAHLNTLEKLGLISRRSGKMRSVSLCGTSDAEGMSVPFAVISDNGISGSSNGSVVIDSSVKHGRELFAFKVNDESMKNAGILRGDTVVFARQAYAENGEIALVSIGGLTVVRRFYHEEGYFRLEPENPDYEQEITDEVKVLGKIVTLVRQYE